MTTWRKELETARTLARDESPVVAVAPDEATLDVEFNGDSTTTEGPPVLIWTAQRAYFPVVYDGLEWLASAPRDPTDTGQEHVGGH